MCDSWIYGNQSPRCYEITLDVEDGAEVRGGNRAKRVCPMKARIYYRTTYSQAFILFSSGCSPHICQQVSLRPRSWSRFLCIISTSPTSYIQFSYTYGLTILSWPYSLPPHLFFHLYLSLCRYDLCNITNSLFPSVFADGKFTTGLESRITTRHPSCRVFQTQWLIVSVGTVR